MKAAAENLRQAFQDVWNDLFSTLVISLIWTLAQLLIIPGPPVTLALFYYANRLANGEGADLSDLWAGVRRYWLVAWRWGLLHYVIIAILIGDYLITEGLIEGTAVYFVRGFYLAALAAWLMLQLYTLPFLFEQKAPSLKTALRNGAVMLGQNIAFSVSLGLLLCLVLAAGILIFMLSFAFGPLLVALAGNHAVIHQVAMVEKQGEV